MNHRVETKPSYSRYKGGSDKKSSVNTPYPTPADYSAQRQAKLKCQTCCGSILGACNRNPIGCADFTPYHTEGVAEFAWDRTGNSMEASLR